MIDHDLSEHLSEHFRDEMSSRWDSFFAGTAGRFKVAYREDAGYDENDDDAPLIICRESDGALFAVQVQALAMPVPSAAGREKAAANLPGDCCWVLWGKCGCPFGVTTGRLGEDLLTVTEGEVWRSFYDDWLRAEADKADGCRVELMTFGRYKTEVAPKMLVKCPHQPEPAGQMELPGVTQ